MTILPTLEIQILKFLGVWLEIHQMAQIVLLQVHQLATDAKQPQGFFYAIVVELALHCPYKFHFSQTI